MLINQDFTQDRANYLGGSDIGALLGLNPYRSPLDLWQEKTGKALAKRESLPMRFGSFAESFVASEYERATQARLLNYPQSLTHPQYPHFQAHIDRFVFPKSECPLPLEPFSGNTCLASHLLECKTANPFMQKDWGEPGSDQVPLSYLCQCAWYLAIAQVQRIDVAVLFGNADFRIYEINRDLALEKILLDKAAQFWQDYVLADLPPPPHSIADCHTLFPSSVPKKTILANAKSLNDLDALYACTTQIEELENKEAEIKQSLMQYLGDAEALEYEGQTLVTWKTPKPTVRWDLKRLYAEQAQLAPLYQTLTPGTRRFIVKAYSPAQINGIETNAIGEAP